MPVERTKPSTAIPGTVTTTTAKVGTAPAAIRPPPSVSTPALAAKQICETGIIQQKPLVAEKDNVFPDPPQVVSAVSLDVHFVEYLSLGVPVLFQLTFRLSCSNIDIVPQFDPRTSTLEMLSQSASVR